MSETKVELKRAEDVQVTNPDGVRSVYANNIGASATATDFRMYFTELGMEHGDVGPVAVQRLKAMVILPLAAIDAMITVLNQVRDNARSAEILARNQGGRREQ